MSDILNHYYCAREVYKSLSDDTYVKSILSKYYDAYRLGSQGPDFFYYNVIFKNSKLSRKLGSLIHKKNINEFFYYGSQFILDFPKYKNITLAYLLGFITHFELDTITHPFIYYRTGWDGNGSLALSKRLHKKFEVLLDTAMMEYQFSKKAVQQHPEKVFQVTPETLDFLESFYHYVTKKIFQIDIPKKLIKSALTTSSLFVSHFSDSNGVKSKTTNVLEKIIRQPDLVSCFFYPESTNEELILNLNNKEWKNPITGEKYTESYPELFFRAVDLAQKDSKRFLKLIEENNITKEEINKIFNNRSYLTGLDSEGDTEIKFIDKEFKDSLI